MIRDTAKRRSKLRRVRGGRRESGQAIILGVFTMLILALMLMMSFNVSQAIHERVRIQQHADAVAYSTATLHARAFNYFAYSNRAMAAGYASMATLHAYMSSGWAAQGMLEGSRNAYMVIAVLEFLASFCSGPFGPIPCCIAQHCQHSMEAAQVAQAYGQEADNYEQLLDSLQENEFEPAVEELMSMINSIYSSQMAMLQHTRMATANMFGGVIGDLTRENAPQAFVNPAITFANANSLMCAVEGTGDDQPCGEREVTPPENQQQVMWEVAMGTRPDWTAQRPVFPHHLHPELLQKLMTDIPEPRGGTTLPIVASSSSEFEEPVGGGDGVISAHDSGMVINMTDCIPFLWSFGGEAETEEWEDDGMGGSASTEAEPFNFIKFRAHEEEFQDGSIFDGGATYFGQPSVYAGVWQDLSVLEDGQHGPWEINQDGRIEIEHGSQGTARLDLTGDQLFPAAAVSKALVYYHQPPPGDWEEHPNFFNPYWRAKLHPFDGFNEYFTTTLVSLRPDGALIWPTIMIVPPWG